ncbi:DNA repair protein RadC [Chitiniphilus purpureus]|uniref:DNA repair protein RadC n=1 Tax=Chitiniphilus purpureus TaxID=2981137 RepID=A0ABY6DJ28_9NEIS|nr:DNA repair protein RadC [Chitiniphilus sp. CD1]UXY14042.1 DNA repair protein RadC [Chitiniphilus sp. CD1]
MPITDWPLAERPREKLLQHGAIALSDAELLAIFLRVGCSGATAVDLARALLTRFGSLNALFAAPQAEFAAVPGMGSAKFAQLQAVLEMSRRALGEQLKEGDALSSPDEVRNYLSLWLRGRPVEVFVAIFLDTGNRVIASEQLAQGSISETRVYPRELARRALMLNASSVIVAHNHPSGRAVPSQADIELTIALRSALALLDIRLLDHFLVAGHKVVSFAEQGYC